VVPALILFEYPSDRRRDCHEKNGLINEKHNIQFIKFVDSEEDS